MPTYRAFQVTGPREFELVSASSRTARRAMYGSGSSCGVCHTDVLAVEGMRADPSQPVVPGHEIVGVIDAVGDGVTAWQVGERVGVGFLGGHCGECAHAAAATSSTAPTSRRPGTTVDGGYAEVVVRQGQRARPHPRGPDLDRGRAAAVRGAHHVQGAAARRRAARARWSPSRASAASATSACSTPRKLGYRVAAIARDTDKAELAADWAPTTTSTAAATTPATHCASSAAPPRSSRRPRAVRRCRRWSPGSHRAASWSSWAPARSRFPVQTPDLIFGTRTHRRQPHRHLDRERGQPRIQPGARHPPDDRGHAAADAPKAYERMMSGDARFRVVLDIASVDA